jgi:hypothetical protein
MTSDYFLFLRCGEDKAIISINDGLLGFVDEILMGIDEKRTEP